MKNKSWLLKIYFVYLGINLKTKVMKNIHVLPTDKPSRISIKDSVLTLHRLQYRKDTQNVYITNDEKPTQGEWCLDLDTNTVFKIGNWKTDRAKKIILTDNEDLIKDGVQAIDDEFLEWFVKNSNCDFVEMKLLDAEENLWEEYYKKNSIYPKYPWYYKIIIPKEEPKQETLEEVAERLFPNKMEEYDIFLMGAKWQQEQDKNLFSELVDLLERLTTIYKEDSDLHLKYDKQRLNLIEQFKSK